MTVEVAVGRIARVHGLAGEVAVDVLTDEPARRFGTGARMTGRPRRGAVRTLTVTEARWHQRRLLVRFAEINDRTAAEEVRGLVLHVDVDPDAAPETEEEFYDHQLVGLRAVDDAGAVLGTVTDVLHNAAQDLLVIDTGGREVLVPFVASLVPVVDLPGGRLVVADRPGLLDPEDAQP